MGKKEKKMITWKPMEINRIVLNPEQAVLSCCDSNTRGRLSAPSPGHQCYNTTCTVTCTQTGAALAS